MAWRSCVGTFASSVSTYPPSLNVLVLRFLRFLLLAHGCTLLIAGIEESPVAAQGRARSPLRAASGFDGAHRVTRSTF